MKTKHSIIFKVHDLFALSAYLWWGLIPIYFKQVDEVAPTEIIIHRLVWTMISMAIIVFGTSRRTAFMNAVTNWKILTALTFTGLCIFTNWFLFVWAVVNSRVHDTSLGYFINPLFMVFLGLVILREKLRPLQILALVVAATGVLLLAIRLEAFPWIALCLPASFGTYGLIKKQVKVDAFVGLFIETLVLMPFAIAYFMWLVYQGHNTFGVAQPGVSVLLILAGPVTAIPLVLFAAGAQYVRMVTLGFLHYFTPTLSFLVAVLLYGERFTPLKMVTFVFIWIALVIYSVDMVLHSRGASDTLTVE